MNEIASILTGTLLISILSFFSYVVYIWIKYGIHTSISASWYSLKEKQKWLFTAWTWGFALPLTIAAMLVGGGWFAFFGGAFISIVGAAPRNWDGANRFLENLFGLREGEKRVHKFFAYAGVLISQVSLAIEFEAYLANIIFVVLSSILLLSTNKAIWWIEKIAYTSYFIIVAKYAADIIMI